MLQNLARTLSNLDAELINAPEMLFPLQYLRNIFQKYLGKSKVSLPVAGSVTALEMCFLLCCFLIQRGFSSLEKERLCLCCAGKS